jgi:hypothetical protein
MAIKTVKQLCIPNAVVTSDSLAEQVAQIEDLPPDESTAESSFGETSYRRTRAPGEARL